MAATVAEATVAEAMAAAMAEATVAAMVEAATGEDAWAHDVPCVELEASGKSRIVLVSDFGVLIDINYGSCSQRFPENRKRNANRNVGILKRNYLYRVPMRVPFLIFTCKSYLIPW